MAYRWKPKNAEVDPDSPRAWGTCGRCGFVWNLHKLQWQYDYRGSPTPVNTFVLVCDKCLDEPQPQNAPYILGPDPEPIFNARPEPYVLDESSWLATQDGNQIVTQNGEKITPNIPSPSFAANTSLLAANLHAPGASLTTAFLDIFDGNPLALGHSVMVAVTGSAARLDISSALVTAGGLARNLDYIVVAAHAPQATNSNYVGIYDAPSGGALLASGPLSSSPTIAKGNPVQFEPLALSVNLT